MKLVTVATHSERYYPYLKLTSEKNGFDLVTLGWGEKWKGFAWRFELMKEYLRSLKTDEIVCFIDGYDVIVLQNINILEKKFISAINGDKSKIVFAIESESDSSLGNFIAKIWSNFFSYKCNGNLINAGTYIGYSSALLDLFESICETFECKNDSDDQILLQRYCQKNSNNFIIDKNSDIFLTMPDLINPISSNRNNIIINNNILTYKSTIEPAIFHAPAYSDIDDIIKDLGYDTTLFKARNENKFNYQFNFFKHFVKELFFRYLIFILLFITTILYLILNKYYNINKKIYKFIKPFINKRYT